MAKMAVFLSYGEKDVFLVIYVSIGESKCLEDSLFFTKTIWLNTKEVLTLKQLKQRL